ncbi:MAG: acetyl-CoA acetyltransferase [Firmicutes bacterium]|jgi:acetyl-CoA C-acetyltransferase|nr:acetyl-CoA acetyltransferase [Bacillota bacterium]
MERVVVVGMARTPIGAFGGSLKDTAAPALGAHVIREALSRAGVSPAAVEEVLIGSLGQVAEEAFLARQCAIGAGLPIETTAMTVNRLCGSGLQAINTGVMTLRSEQASVVVAGGTEAMSRYPFISRGARWGLRMGDAVLEDSLLKVLSCPFNTYHMGITAENVAMRYGISREEQDQFALVSQQRAAAAMEAGRFTEQIAPLEVPAGKGKARLFETDEYARPDTTIAKLAALRPAFAKDGTVTAGNASGVNDGAAALVLTTAVRADAEGWKPLAEVVDFAVAGVDPAVMGIGPIPAIQKLVARTGVPLSEVGVFELNEAFAAQSLAVVQSLALDPARVNPNGGAIALGHPVGATGAIISCKLIAEMRRCGLEYGIASLCIGGGQGIATLFRLTA